MEQNKRIERIAALTKILIDHPHQQFPFAEFCTQFQVAKPTLSDDIRIIRSGLAKSNLGIIETIPGFSGGVHYIPGGSDANDNTFLMDVAAKLSSADRILPGGLLYMTDILCNPGIVSRLGEILMKKLYELHPDRIMTEGRGIPLALFVARAFNVPLVIAQHGTFVTEGPSISISYVSGSNKNIQTMTMPKRSVQNGERLLVIDDLMKGGGTAHGMIKLAGELGANVVGKAFLIEAVEPEEKIISNYTALLRLYKIDEVKMKIDIRPVTENK